MTSAAAAVAKAVGYTNAGTIEFLLDEDGKFYFLEMNTRLQVEHPITEMVTGLDLVRWQIRIARGERLDLDPQRLLTPNGHAIECRIYAEDPDNNFLPSPGRIQQLRVPSGPGIRDDSGATAGLDVPIFYDPMISKLVAWAEDRPLAIARMQRALGEYLVTGIKTTVPFFTWLLAQPEFLAGRFHTTYLDEMLKTRNGRPFVETDAEAEDMAAIAAALEAVMSPSALASDAADAIDRAAELGPLAQSGPRRRAPLTCNTRSKSEGGASRSSSRGRATVLQSRSTDARRQVDAARIDAHTLSLLVADGLQAVPSQGTASKEVSLAPNAGDRAARRCTSARRRSPSRSTAGGAGDERTTPAAPAPVRSA